MNATPGPWTTDGRFIVQNLDGRSFMPGQPFIADCQISEYFRNQENTGANARLIAAAPTMLAALQAVNPADCTLAVREMRRAAIAKATGGN